MSLPILGQSQALDDDESGPRIRLLHCKTCGTVEELPDFDGPPQYDDLLNISVERHRFPSGDSHVGVLCDVSLKKWVRPDVRKAVVEQLKGGGLAKGLGAIDESYYDTKSTFHEDALKCFSQHLRPKGQCPDYMSSSKVLLPQTNADRKELGLTPVERIGGPKTYLCQFCPVHAYNVTKAREQRGMYQ